MFAPYKKGPRLKEGLARAANDPLDRRLGHSVRNAEAGFDDLLAKVSENDFVILGYPDDRGVERNGGRPGACEAPDEIREVLFKMTPSPLGSVLAAPVLWDAGNFLGWNFPLLEAHEEARKKIAELRRRRVRIVSLGGGHDWAYADFADWSGALVNLDAHLDMRPAPENSELVGNSGTAFRRILRDEKSLQICAIGLQKHCNARAHLDWAGAFHVSALFLEEMDESFDAQWALIANKLAHLKGPIALSIDMDVFAQAIAPGVSAPQALGLDPRLAFKLLRTLGPKIGHLGIYETNPRYDRDQATARLAAKFVHDFLQL